MSSTNNPTEDPTTLPLPTGAATEAKQDAILAELELKANPTETQEVVGDVAENTPAAGNPVLTGGRFDSAARTLDTTDVGAIALDENANVQTVEQQVGLAGVSITATIDLPTANTRVKIPNIPPSDSYQLEICFVGAGPFYVTTTDTGTAGTDGLKFEAGEKYYKVLAGGKAIWVASNFSGDDVKVETTEVS